MSNRLYDWNHGEPPDGDGFISDFDIKHGPGSVVEWRFDYTVEVGGQIIKRTEYTSRFDNHRNEALALWYTKVEPETGGELLRIEAWAGETELIYEKGGQA